MIDADLRKLLADTRNLVADVRDLRANMATRAEMSSAFKAIIDRIAEFEAHVDVRLDAIMGSDDAA